jgi:hypothetical protein
MKYYVNVEEAYQIHVYKTDGENWYALFGWHPRDVLFTRCKKPTCKLVPIENIITLDGDPNPNEEYKYE